jgi:hypothetical protein
VAESKHPGVYVGRMLICGCVMALTTDNRGKDTARDVADFIKDGMIVTHVTFDEYKNVICLEPGFMDCKHEPSRIHDAAQQPLLFAAPGVE